MTTTPNKPTLLYIADPMCSWCWGFSPVMTALFERFDDRLDVQVIMGGLRPGTETPMDAQSKATIRAHWQHVNEATDQPFDHEFFDREGFIYDTEPPSRAVVAARRMAPQATYRFLAHLHGAFYRDNVDITDDHTLCGLAASFGLDRATFAEQLADEATRAETQDDFARARALGVNGFPSLIAPVADGRMAVITTGYRPWSAIEPVVETWLRQFAVEEGYADL